MAFERFIPPGERGANVDEIWAIIPEFPRYSVSNFGRIKNNISERILSLSKTLQGATKITFREREGLYKENIIYCTRSVKVLVAEAFVHNPSEPWFDTPVCLDGDQRNNMSTNLAWRPRWFAWRYTRQFKNIPPYCEMGPICDITTGDYYRNIYDASIVNGLLFIDVWECAFDSRKYEYQKPIFPTHQIFSLMAE